MLMEELALFLEDDIFEPRSKQTLKRDPSERVVSFGMTSSFI
jgi:hypothetical protein